MGKSIALEIIVKFKCWRPLELQQSRILRAENIWILWARRNLQSERTLNVSIITLQLPSLHREIKGTIYSDCGFRYMPEANWSWAGSAKRYFTQANVQVLLLLFFQMASQKNNNCDKPAPSNISFLFSTFFSTRHKNISRYI